MLFANLAHIRCPLQSPVTDVRLSAPNLLLCLSSRLVWPPSLPLPVQIEEDCARLAAKAEAAKKQQEQLTRENDAKLQAKKVRGANLEVQCHGRWLMHSRAACLLPSTCHSATRLWQGCFSSVRPELHASSIPLCPPRTLKWCGMLAHGPP